MTWEDQTTRCCGITYHKAGPGVVKLVVPRRPPGPDKATRQLASDSQYLLLSDAIASVYPFDVNRPSKEELMELDEEDETAVLSLENLMNL